MTAVNLHLMLNHIPIFALPVSLIFLAYGLIKKQSEVTRFSLFVTAVVALIVLPVYFSGEPAEEFVEGLPGFSHGLIHSHEEAAELSLVLVLITAALSGLSLFVDKMKLKYAVLGIGIIAVVSLINTGHLGGKIRHTELVPPGYTMSSHIHSR